MDPTRLFVWRQSRRVASMADGIAALPRENPFAGEVDSMPEKDFALLAQAVLERRCRDEVGFGSFAEAAAMYRPKPRCPDCRAENPARWGREGNVLQRYVRRECGRHYNSRTGTVLEHSKSDMPTWVDFVRLMRFNVPLDAVAEVCRVSHQTAWEWRHRLFATVDGYQDGLAGHIAEGSIIVGDRGRPHNAPVRAVRGTHEAYKADVRDPVYLGQVAMVNNLCSWLKRYLWRFTGMDMKYLQSFLNWYVYLFRVKQAEERWPEVARVVRHLLMTDTHFRSKRARSDQPAG